MTKAFLYDLGDIFFEAHFWRRWMFDYFISNKKFSGSFFNFYTLYETFLAEVYAGKSKYELAFNKFVYHLSGFEDQKFIETAFKKKRFFEQTRKLYDGVKETLEELKNRNILNIVITDNELTEQAVRKKVIERYNINHLINKVYTSLDYGLTKPDPEFFSLVIKANNLSVQELFFVAHDPDEIEGAKKVGIRVIELNNYSGQNTTADFKIKHFRELLNFV